ncbi:MAG: hypothetical protein V4812_22090 [Pseudomonadota bacterium]
MPTTAASPRSNAPRHPVRRGLAALLLVLTSSALPLQPHPTSPLEGSERALRKTATAPCVGRDQAALTPLSLPQPELRSPAPSCDRQALATRLEGQGSDPWLPYLAVALLLSAVLALCCLLLTLRLNQQNRRLKRAVQALQPRTTPRDERDPLTGLHTPAIFQKQALLQEPLPSL